MPIPERSYIYFLQMHKSHVAEYRAHSSAKIRVPAGSIKIGYTVNLDQRIKSHNRTLPPFTVLGIIVWKHSNSSIARRGDGIEAEDLIHRHFAFSRLDKRKGNYKNFEFFKPTKRLLSFIKRNTTSLDSLDTAPEYELEWLSDDENFAAFLPANLFGKSKHELDQRFPCIINKSGIKIPPSLIRLAMESNDDDQTSDDLS